MAQMKEQIKTLETELNQMEIINLSDTEFKTLVIRMLKELSENPNRIKKIQSEMKATLIEIKNYLQGNKSRVNEAKNQINDLEHKEATHTHTQTQHNKKKKESRKMRRGLGTSGTTSSTPTFAL